MAAAFNLNDYKTPLFCNQDDFCSESKFFYGMEICILPNSGFENKERALLEEVVFRNGGVISEWCSK